MTERERDKARIKELEGALIICRRVFSDYFEIHLSKGPKGQVKAASNKAMVDYCNKALKGAD